MWRAKSMTVLKKTYRIEAGGPPPMAWKTYQALVKKRWKALLCGDSSRSEKAVQRFLEKHPCMVPGAFGFAGGLSGHYPWVGSVIAEPVLPSYNHRSPDFMWIARDSVVDEPVLVEIEAPNKKWWTGKGRPHAKLTQARDQITEWKAWFGRPENVLAFKAFYGLDRETWQGRTFRPSYVLIYGRRAEANVKPALTAKRANMWEDDVTVMTYDRLSPNPEAAELFCVTKNAEGFTALSVPPTMTWNPMLARERWQIQGKEAAIEANVDLSRERKEFLISRAGYWDRWATCCEEGVVSSCDEE
jgi:hypothetical protein